MAYRNIKILLGMKPRHCLSALAILVALLAGWFAPPERRFEQRFVSMPPAMSWETFQAARAAAKRPAFCPLCVVRRLSDIVKRSSAWAGAVSNVALFICPLVCSATLAAWRRWPRSGASSAA